MKILNFGSLNIDYVYQMDHFIRKGETFAADRLDKFCGGKGLNQSVALAKAGAEVYHAGNIGADGSMLTEMLISAGVHTEYVRTTDTVVTGHAVIQVEKTGNNSIILYHGANYEVTEKQVDEVLSHFNAGDYLILQNEINKIEYLMNQAYDRGMKIIFNPSPMSEEVGRLPLQKVGMFLLNEVEGADITGVSDPDQIIERLLTEYPHAGIVLTLGSEGSRYADAQQRISQPIYRVERLIQRQPEIPLPAFLFRLWQQVRHRRQHCHLRQRQVLLQLQERVRHPRYQRVRKLCIQN